ncbi:hypothetical protein [Neoroseomonas lacus]|uniref:Uncharacterized protein n=1 Tax=Neoroseomonas lacus TaxID=287609 RepID=A0A917L582_9PROT|nr:hypothetical protein [Neoroseomonas lacus]GGJ41163.1 hypothetical protein GCM10011320_55960 [Neoroseomonas lacus]
MVESRVDREDQHSEVPIVHLIASRLVDRSDLLEQLGKFNRQDDDAWAKRTLGRADEVNRRVP